jgi:hypothetical protein
VPVVDLAPFSAADVVVVDGQSPVLFGGVLVGAADRVANE